MHFHLDLVSEMTILEQREPLLAVAYIICMFHLPFWINFFIHLLCSEAILDKLVNVTGFTD